MGLAGRKVKQRIGNDPRNLSWADDAARFGQNYLAKFGWDSSKGLGISGDGRTTHIKVSHKLDLMGIGAAHQKDPNGIAWKQNRDFENLLRRLNDGAGDGGVETSEREEGGDVGLKMGGGWMKAKETSVNVQEDENGEEQEAGSNGNSGKKKKRKRKAEDTEESSSSKSKKKRKKENEEDDDYKSVENKKDKKKKMSTSQDVESNATLEKSGGDPALVKDKPADTPEPTSASGTNTPVIPRHRAHRARAIAAKKQASRSATALSEIFGIAPTTGASSSSTSVSHAPQGTLTPITDDNFSDEHLTISRKSVADYFKEKLSAAASKGKKFSPSVSGAQTPVPQLEEAVIDSSSKVEDTPPPYENEPRRAGLGSYRVRFALPDEVEEDALKASKKCSSLMSSFSPASSTPTLTSSTSADTNEGKAPDAGPIADLPRIPTDDERKFQPKEGKRKEEKKRKADKESSRGSEQEKKRKRKERPESKLLSDVTSQVPGSIDAQEGGDPVGAPDEESQVSKAEKKLLSKEERKKIKAEKKARKREQANEL